MKNKYNKGIGTLLAIVVMALGGALAGYLGSKADQNTGATFQSPDVRALFETSLASKITSSATTMTLTSATDKDGNTLASSTYGFIIDEGTANEEVVLADCTATACTNMTRGISVRTGTTTVSALQFEHRRGASVKVTDAPSLIFAVNVFKGRQNIENILTYSSTTQAYSSTTEQLVSARFVLGAAGTASTSAFRTVLDSANTFSLAQIFTATSTFSSGARTTAAYDCQTGANSLTLCSKAYVDAVAVAGASNADTTTKGIVEEATAAEILSGAGAGGTSARLYVNPARLVEAGATSTLMVATTSLADMATTTLRGIPFGRRIHFSFEVATTSNQAIRICFNEDWGGCKQTTGYYFHQHVVNGVANTGADASTYATIISGGAGTASARMEIEMDMSNSTSTVKMGTATAFQLIPALAPTSIDSGPDISSVGWASSTAAINSVSLITNEPTLLIGAGTIMRAYVLP